MWTFLLSFLVYGWLGSSSNVIAPRSTYSALDYRVSWLGNSFSGKDNRWIQNFFIHANVRPDGSVITWSHWDEGGKRFGIYKDGDVVGDKDLSADSLSVRDQQGRLWKLEVAFVDPENNEFDFRPLRITVDGQTVNFPGLHEPTALALSNAGQLMVADSGTGPRQQILFYDVKDPKAPVLVRTFGDEGGIGSGVPGVVTPSKLWGIRGVGMDRDDNIFVAMSEMGSVLRKFSPKGRLSWELYGHFFVDVTCADPESDGEDVWGIQEHYKMDYSRPSGQEARWVGYSLNRHRYPNDPRGLTFVKQQGEHGLTSPQIVYLDGKRFMFVGGMFASNFITIFRYEGEMAVPSGTIMQWGNNLFRTNLKWPPHRPAGTFLWRDVNGDGDYQANEYSENTPRVRPGPFWVDRKGNVWMANGFFRYDYQGLDPRGNPIYRADKVTVMDPPHGVKSISRVWYDCDTDTLIVAEEGVDEEGRPDMRHIGKIHICRKYLGGQRDTISFVSGAAGEAGCLAAAGDFVFTGGWKARGKVWINRISDGSEVGVLEPGPSLGGVENTGWVDILTGITAHRRKNGEYLVFVEEDYKAKVILYRWTPRS